MARAVFNQHTSFTKAVRVGNSDSQTQSPANSLQSFALTRFLLLHSSGSLLCPFSFFPRLWAAPASYLRPPKMLWDACDAFRGRGSDSACPFRPSVCYNITNKMTYSFMAIKRQILINNGYWTPYESRLMAIHWYGKLTHVWTVTHGQLPKCHNQTAPLRHSQSKASKFLGMSPQNMTLYYMVEYLLKLCKLSFGICGWYMRTPM